MEKADESTILVGTKPLSQYSMALNIVLDKHPEATIKARGKAILTAINLAEISKRNGSKIKSMQTSSETFKTDEGKEIRVSAIEIKIEK